MEVLSALSMADIVSLAVLAVILLSVLFVLRLIFKLTATLFRLGCFVVLAIVAGAAILLYVG
jgi:hypothetical protein